MNSKMDRWRSSSFLINKRFNFNRKEVLKYLSKMETNLSDSFIDFLSKKIILTDIELGFKMVKVTDLGMEYPLYSMLLHLL